MARRKVKFTGSVLRCSMCIKFDIFKLVPKKRIFETFAGYLILFRFDGVVKSRKLEIDLSIQG